MGKPTILLTGGAGYIGSYVNKLLYKAGYQTVIIDDLSSGRRENLSNGTLIVSDFADKEQLNHIFTTYKIEGVIHFAAQIAVEESVANPHKYYEHNVGKTLDLLGKMQEHGVNKLIFSSTAAIFGNPVHLPVPVDHPTQPINPYGNSKLMVESILKDFDAAYGLRYTALRYFNAAGADPEGDITPDFSGKSHLIPIVLNALKANEGKITIFGSDYEGTVDGTCVRDYIHIHDLATAHLLTLEALLKGAASTQYNLGNGKGFSVREVIAAAEKVTGLKVPVVEGPRRAGDPPQLVADSSKVVKELGWNPKYGSLEEIITHSWSVINQESGSGVTVG
jgi:UDP-glucose 4-epimerase